MFARNLRNSEGEKKKTLFFVVVVYNRREGKPKVKQQFDKKKAV